MFGTATTGTRHDIRAIPGLWRDAQGEAEALSSRGMHHAALRSAMLKDRKIVLMDRLGWDLQSPDGLHELDEYDDEDTLYLIVHQPETGRHLGSVRLLPSTGAHLLGDKFAHLCADGVPVGPDVWEITRLVTDPYARRPLAMVARANVAADPQGVRGETAQLALGLRQTLLPGVSLSVERLVPLGAATQGAFAARLAAGARWQRLEAYGEAGVIDTGQVYAGGQARARVVRFGPATLNAATLASVQTGSIGLWRVDVGPSLSTKVKGIRIESDWRQRVGGNAAPCSGPVLTVSAGF